jgi:hypothetical protein
MVREALGERDRHGVGSGSTAERTESAAGVWARVDAHGEDERVRLANGAESLTGGAHALTPSVDFAI